MHVQFFIGTVDQVVQILCHSNPLLGRLSNIGNDLRECHGPPIVQRHLISGQGFHNGYRLTGRIELTPKLLVAGAVLIEQVLKIVQRDILRCRELTADGHVLLLIGQVDIHKSAAAKSAGVRLKKSNGQCGGHAGIDRVSSRLQDLNTNLRSLLLSRGDGTVVSRSIPCA